MAVGVTVLDPDGRPVAGLSAEDFQITLNGKLQPVRTLSYTHVTEPAEGRTATPAPSRSGHVVTTNAIPAGEGRVFVLAIDDLSFSADEGRRLLAAARTFVESQPANALVGLVTTSGSVSVNPTHDRPAVVAALKRVVGVFIDPRRSVPSESPLIGIGEALEIAAHNNTAALDTAITRECRDGGRALQTGEAGSASNAIGNYNSKCASDLATAARFMASVAQGLARQQVSAIGGVLHAMKHAPGLRQLIVLTQGVAGTRNFASLFEPIVEAAAVAGIQVSILTEDDVGVDLSSQDRGTTGLGQVVGSSLVDRRREDRAMFTVALQSLADLSGGTFERVIADAGSAFGRAALAGSGVYHLGVEPPPNLRDSQPISVSASVSRADLTVRVNRLTVAPAGAAGETAAARVAAAIRKGTQYYAVPMRLGVARRRAAHDQIELELDVDVPATVQGPLRITVGVLDARGALRQGTEALPPSNGGNDYRHTITMPVAAGDHRVRVAVEDANGLVGSVNADVDARLNVIGPFLASDVLTWWRGASGLPRLFALDDVPAGAAMLTAAIELYSMAGETVPQELSVRLSIAASGAPTPVAEVGVVPRVDGGVRRAEATLPLGSLPPGVYVLTASVLGDGKGLGQISTSIRVPAR